MVDYRKFPVCDVTECFGCEDGHCIVLIEKNFGERECPFFKTREQVAEEKEYCRNRLADIRKGNVEE